MKITYSSQLPPEKAYFKLFQTTGWNENYRLTSYELKQSLRNSTFCISAYFKGKLIGFGRMLSDGIAHAVLFDIIVDPDFMKKGIGSAITNQLIAECEKNRIRDVQLFCAAGKVKFYQKLGFKKRPEDAPGMEIRMRYDKTS